MTTLARVVCTCPSVPTQWDAWDTNGQYYYLRYRFGRGTVDAYDDSNPATWDVVPDGYTAAFRDPDEPLKGEIELDEFLEQAGLQLAPGAVVVPYGEYVTLAHRTTDDEVLLRHELEEPTA
jgi:hypothetical protein